MKTFGPLMLLAASAASVASFPAGEGHAVGARAPRLDAAAKHGLGNGTVAAIVNSTMPAVAATVNATKAAANRTVSSLLAGKAKANNAKAPSSRTGNPIGSLL